MIDDYIPWLYPWLIPTLVHKVSRNDNMRSNRRIRQRGNTFNSHALFPLLTELHECEYLA